METVIMHPKNSEQLSALKGFAKALKVEFETSPYSPDFVAKLKASKIELKMENSLLSSRINRYGKFTVIVSRNPYLFPKLH
jgi:hypothetical protein